MITLVTLDAAFNYGNFTTDSILLISWHSIDVNRVDYAITPRMQSPAFLFGTLYRPPNGKSFFTSDNFSPLEIASTSEPLRISLFR